MNKYVRKTSRAQFWVARLLASVLFLLAAVQSASAQSEEAVKAAFVYNFSKFVNWPTNAFAGDRAPITVGFVGTDSLASTFEKMVSGRNINGHEFVIKRLSAAPGAENCQMVFVSEAAAVAVISATAGKPILTIGDGENFSTAGGMIRLFKDGAKIRFDLDFTNVKSAQLKLDARLCQLARNVKGR